MYLEPVVYIFSSSFVDIEAGNTSKRRVADEEDFNEEVLDEANPGSLAISQNVKYVFDFLKCEIKAPNLLGRLLCRQP